MIKLIAKRCIVFTFPEKEVSLELEVANINSLYLYIREKCCIYKSMTVRYLDIESGGLVPGQLAVLCGML